MASYSSIPPSLAGPSAQAVDDADIVQEMYRLLGNLTRSFVPATRKKREESKEDRRARKELKDALDDMGYDIIELKAESASSGRRPDQSMVVDSVRRKINRLSVDGGYESANRFANILSRLSDPQGSNQMRNLQGILELLDALAFTASDPGAFASPASRAVSGSGKTREPDTTATPYAIADAPATSGPPTASTLAPARNVESNSHAALSRARPVAAESLPVKPAKAMPEAHTTEAPVQSSKQLISASDLKDRGEAVSKSQLLQQLRQRLGQKQIPEDELLQDVIFLMQGINGRHVRFQEELQYDAAAEQGAETAGLAKVVRVVFNEGEAGWIDAPTKRIVHRLAELGQLYKRVSEFSQNRSTMPASGLIMQSLCHFLSNELQGFYRLVASLEAQMHTQGKLGGGDDESGTHRRGKEGGEKNAATTYVTLKRLSLWTEEMTLRFRLMSTIIESCQDAHGGSLVSLIHSYTFNGDPFIRQFTSSLLDEVSKPFFRSLSLWIYEGELQDPFREFFVELNDDPRNSGQNKAGTSGSDGEQPSFGDLDGDAASLWQNKFIFRKERLPSFLQESFGRKIFSTGKSLNFIRQSCGDGDWVATRHTIASPSAELRYTDLTGLESTIERAFTSASKRLLDIFLDEFRLLEHLRALKDYLMLARGDFVDLLMASLGPSLSRPANSLFRHNLTASLETAIRGSNAQHDDPEILRRLDARILEFSIGDIGWDTFTLEYKLDSPVNMVLDNRAMVGYQTIFTHLWKIKRVELALNSSWLRLHESGTSLCRIKRGTASSMLGELRSESQRAMLMLSEMIHFIRQMQGFAQLEVIEYSWNDLLNFFSRRQGDLDELIESHRAYLNALIGKVLLRGGKRGSQDHLAGELRAQFDSILAFTVASDDLTHLSTRELARHDMERGVATVPTERGARARTVSKTGASSSALSLAPCDPMEVSRIVKRLSEASGTFQERMVVIVGALEKHANLTVRDLAVRLNFNGRYEVSSRRSSGAANASTSAGGGLRKKEVAAASVAAAT
ncbi:related to Spindle pole body component alp6 [Melanopsichium pennsylvanicum]|uniref:Related to Spindle pole body component alp6 n=2 Tax=Melanopsichium pennsylvanicum TaxID=63383 RepID=A0AAJ4XHP0_9BASI|nr:related to Spindle pole body component alp6 [Melanopsichium pennsylvanicum 4]SNX82323.1 related to Spindle pole body component alp6 [Melanopsichium pennsylvanicum]